MPLHDDRRLFELLTLEGAQAGLSWSTILHKRDGYRSAFAGFDPAAVARFDRRRIERLLRQSGDRAQPAEGRVDREQRATCRARCRTRATASMPTSGSSWTAPRSSGRWKALGDIPAETAESKAMSKDMKRSGLSLRRTDRLLRVHAGRGSCERPRHHLLSVPRTARAKQWPERESSTRLVHSRTETADGEPREGKFMKFLGLVAVCVTALLAIAAPAIGALRVQVQRSLQGQVLRRRGRPARCCMHAHRLEGRGERAGAEELLLPGDRTPPCAVTSRATRLRPSSSTTGSRAASIEAVRARPVLRLQQHACSRTSSPSGPGRLSRSVATPSAGATSRSAGAVRTATRSTSTRARTS